MLSAVVLLFGSPPRVRGKRTDTWSAYLYMRITPACAGKTRPAWEKAVVGADHPRVCGENAGSHSYIVKEHGSPPRVRGKPIDTSPSTATWITPACAGKTFSASKRLGKNTDHPRVCGENRMHSLSPLQSNGSPPRVRGKQLPAGRLPASPRITPACAGKTLL